MSKPVNVSAGDPILLAISTEPRRARYVVKILGRGRRRQVLDTFNIKEDLIKLTEIRFTGDARINYMGFTHTGKPYIKQ